MYLRNGIKNCQKWNIKMTLKISNFFNPKIENF